MSRPGLHAYTDGSQTSTSAGAAFVVFSDLETIQAVQRFRLASPGSSFNAETFALHQLIQYFFSNTPTSPLHIYTDCLCLLMALNNPFTISSSIQTLKDNISFLPSIVPVNIYHAHSGVWGNELVDIIAIYAAT
ncbi:hypothetical protein HPB48_013679 [Haemaphysalis longicornis]|uniref:RNase H type-1 domain-containing protein n=1 Tax=Haemaphysalis longicornis TaxID=44386 RepID=A0A9J6GHJ2_HAELO|nr:hypothetical protein HPB48_013679 [Haemaphysalis longicornis]